MSKYLHIRSGQLQLKSRAGAKTFKKKMYGKKQKGKKKGQRDDDDGHGY